VSFPALTTRLQPTTNGLTAVSTNASTTAVLSRGPGGMVVQIIGADNLNRIFNGVSFPNVLSRDFYDYGGEPLSGLSYVALGGWGQWGWGGWLENPLQSFGLVAFGYETPQSGMPISGTAVFTGVSLGSVFSSVGGDIRSTSVMADAAFSVDFASGKITGAFTHSHYFAPTAWLPWNDVSLTASIAAGTNKFSGATAVTTSPQTAFTLNPSATGSITGAFYGPAAQNLGAIWTLSDGTTTAIGGVAASH